LDEAIDRLYQEPLAGFTEARNALAAERKAAGDKGGAERVRGLAKPTAVAWAANQLYWRERARFDALGAALMEVATAQREGLAGGSATDLREAMRRKAEALHAAAHEAERRLVESGAASSPAVLQRITSTLEALASPRPAGEADAVLPGRLTTDLQPAGFDVALGLGSMNLPPLPPRPAPEAPTVATSPPASKQEEDAAAWSARVRVQEAESEVGRLRREIETASRALNEAEAAALAARTDVAGLEARLVQARARADTRGAAEDAARLTLEDLQKGLAAALAELESARRLQ
jgi:hypothetical protein